MIHTTRAARPALLLSSLALIAYASCDPVSGSDGELGFVTTQLFDGRRDHPYSAALAVAGGTRPYSFSVSSGQLPAGLSLDRGSLTGVPSVDGRFVFTVTVRDSATPAAISSQAFVLMVHPDLDGIPYYVDPNGDDSYEGSFANPWRTLRHAVSRLGAGDTLYLRGGTYFERDIPVSVAGTAADPITIRNYPAEDPVVDGGFAEFRARGNQDWEYFGSRGIYRSVGTYHGLSYVYGYFGARDGGYRLVTYEDFGPLGTDNQDYTDARPYYYIGPGVFWSSYDSKIYVRLEHSKYEAPMGYDVPGNTDPRQTPLYLFPDGAGLEFTSTAAHIAIEGVRFRYLDSPLHFTQGAHHVTVRRCELLGGRYHALVRGGAHHLIFDEITILDAFPPWVARSDVKRPSSGRPGHRFQGAGISLQDAVDHVEIRNSTFVGLFDAIGASGTPTNLHVHHNLFNVIRDDVLQIGSAGYRIEFDHNTVLNAAAGVSWSGSGAPPAGELGTKYVHHNVIDTSTPQLYGRSDPQGLLPPEWRGPNGDGMTSGRTFAMHSRSAITGPDPWKIYHNTALVMQDVDERGAGQCYDIVPADPSFPHEVFNNIFIQVSDYWIGTGARVGDGSQIHDGNLYFREAPGATTPLFASFWNAGLPASFGSLAEFESSSYQLATRTYYPPGWEASGIEADPRLDVRHRPDPTGPAATGAVDLTGRGWPGLAGESFRGALPPRSP